MLFVRFIEEFERAKQPSSRRCVSLSRRLVTVIDIFVDNSGSSSSQVFRRSEVCRVASHQTSRYALSFAPLTL